MFTVIICDKSVIKDCTNKYKIHFKPLLENKDLVFCQWNRSATTFEDAVPTLNELIKSKKDWRAVVVNDHHIMDENVLFKPNPFDYVGTKKIPNEFDTKEDIINFRNYVDSSAKLALENPLMKLSLWLNGYSSVLRPYVVSEEEMYKSEPFSDEYNKILSREKVSIMDFETSVARAHRFDVIKENFIIDGEMFNPPKQVIAISERAIDIDLIEAETVWHNYREQEYSTFAEDNLYSSKIRFLTFQIQRKKGKIHELDYFKFLTTLLVFSGNDISFDLFRPGRVYKLSSDLDDEKVKQVCNNYIYKLKKTLNKITFLRERRKRLDSIALSNKEVREEFEDGITVPVKMIDGYEQDSLMCEYNKIGLSNECPINEKSYWENQFTELKKHFGRFLRQPHRSIKNAVDVDFVGLNTLNDERAKKLTEFQRDDIVFTLQEEEQSMVETITSKVFDKKHYDEMLDEADKVVKRGIKHRMTKKKTLILGTLFLLVSLIGFIPLIISEFNSLGTGAFSLLLIAISLGVLSAIMFICLFVLKKRLVNRFKHFNYVMSGIYSEVISSLDRFSEYLSHTCNVMRKFSVLNTLNNKVNYKQNIYTKHEIEIKRCINSISQLFPEYIDEEYISEDTVEAYSYDFEQDISYEYFIPYKTVFSTIQFLNKGTTVDVPIDYIKSIDVRREEFYD